MKTLKEFRKKKKSVHLFLFWGIIITLLGILLFYMHYKNQSWINAIPFRTSPIVGSMMYIVIGIITIIAWIKFIIKKEKYI